MEENMRLFDLKIKNLENITNTKKEENKNINIKIHDEDPAVRNNYLRPKNIKNTDQNEYEDIIDNQKRNYSYSQIKYQEEYENQNFNSTKVTKKEKFANSKFEKKKEYDSELYLNEIDSLKNQILTRDKEIKIKNEELRNLQKVIENLRSENINLKSNLNKKEEDLLHNKLKVNEIESEKKKIENKFSNDENILKNLKSEYVNMTKNFQMAKKQIENLTNKLEDSKAENYNTIHENNELKRKISSLEKKSSFTSDHENFKNSNYSKCFQIRPNLERTEQVNIFTKIQKIEDLENYFPSEAKFVENKHEFAYYEKKLSTLLKQKLLNENEIFKLPDKPRTLNEINRKKDIEESLKNIDNEIADVKFKLRKLNGKSN